MAARGVCWAARVLLVRPAVGTVIAEVTRTVADPARAPWFTATSRWSHFLKHGKKLGAVTVDDYDESARETIRAGRRFTYRDRTTGKDRVGYYHASTERFTAMTDDEAVIMTHFVCLEIYVCDLPGSSYQR